MSQMTNAPQLQALLGSLRELIRDARQRALRAVDVIQVQTCWQMGRHIVEFEQGGAVRRVQPMANACCPNWPRR